MLKDSRCRIGVMVSGSGTNLQAIIDRIESGEINAEIACVISNNPDAYALVRAARHNIPAVVHKHDEYSGRNAYDTATVKILKGFNVDLVVLAGYMRILSATMVDAFSNAIINIHPALLPSFPGLHAQKQALDYGVRYTGCTVHFVDTGTDTGPIIIQEVVPVEDGDTEQTLSLRIQAAEHSSFSKAIKLFTEGRIRVVGRRVEISS